MPLSRGAGRYLRPRSSGQDQKLEPGQSKLPRRLPQALPGPPPPRALSTTSPRPSWASPARTGATWTSPPRTTRSSPQGVNGTRGGAGYFGLAYYQQYQSLVNAAAIRNPGTGQCVEPSAASVADGTYLPLARPILIYVQAGLLDTSPELKAFIDFYLDEAPKLVPEVGYVALPEAAYDWGRDRVNGRVTGSVFKDVPPGTPLDAALSRVQ